jgi:hypothetical protein
MTKPQRKDQDTHNTRPKPHERGQLWAIDFGFIDETWEDQDLQDFRELRELERFFRGTRLA